MNASHNKSSIFNERNSIIIERKDKSLVAFTQIAGMLARRIVCEVHEGQELEKGAVCGIIRFGSRCDVWLPIGITPCVIKGQTMIGGETVIANTKTKQNSMLEGKEL